MVIAAVLNCKTLVPFEPLGVLEGYGIVSKLSLLFAIASR
jgi:hypothetical protein